MRKVVRDPVYQGNNARSRMEEVDPQFFELYTGIAFDNKAKVQGSFFEYDHGDTVYEVVIRQAIGWRKTCKWY